MLEQEVLIERTKKAFCLVAVASSAHTEIVFLLQTRELSESPRLATVNLGATVRGCKLPIPGQLPIPSQQRPNVHTGRCANVIFIFFFFTHALLAEASEETRLTDIYIS